MQMWLQKATPSKKAGPAPAKRATIDVAVDVRIATLQAPVRMTIVDITVEKCRARSWVVLDKQRRVEFDWRDQSGHAIHLKGEIAVRRPAANGGAFEYDIAFDATPAADVERLARDLATVHRIVVAKRDLTPAGQTAFQSGADIAIRYRVESRSGIGNGKATDIGGNGLRMSCNEALRIGEALSVQFRLPNAFADVPDVANAKGALNPFRFGTEANPNPGRPFEEFKLEARVTQVRRDAQGRCQYALEFIEIDAYSREELARYVHQKQLGKLRGAGAA